MKIYTELQESLNRPYKWKKGRSTSKSWTASFATDDKYKYKFNAVYVKRKEGVSWGVTFSLENPPADKKLSKLGLTGTAGGAGALRIFATIKNIFETFVKEVSPDKITFSADKTENVRGTRVRLYDRFTKKFAAQYGYELEIKDNVIDVDYVFRRINKKGNTSGQP
jgi:hypothetical protein